jgi:hypothetical protein
MIQDWQKDEYDLRRLQRKSAPLKEQQPGSIRKQQRKRFLQSAGVSCQLLVERQGKIPVFKRIHG